MYSRLSLESANMMKKNDLHLGDDGEFTVDLDVPASGKQYQHKEKSKDFSTSNGRNRPNQLADYKDALVIMVMIIGLILIVFSVISEYPKIEYSQSRTNQITYQPCDDYWIYTPANSYSYIYSKDGLTRCRCNNPYDGIGDW
jgi:hypothetical protein